MRYIPHEDNWEKEYFEDLKQQRKVKKSKKLKQINKWNKSKSPAKKGK